MGIIAWIVVGAIAGFITNLIMGGKEGVIETIILGIIGAVVGGFLAGTVLKVADVTGINITSIVVAVIGAIIVVLVYRMSWVDAPPSDRSIRFYPSRYRDARRKLPALRAVSLFTAGQRPPRAVLFRRRTISSTTAFSRSSSSRAAPYSGVPGDVRSRSSDASRS